jgi:hypothetical protein
MRKIVLIILALCASTLMKAQTTGAAGVQSLAVTLSAAQLQHLSSTPVQLVAPPGTGLMICVLSSTARYKAGSTPYAVQSGRLNIYAGNTGNSAGATPAAGFIDQASNQVRVMGNPSSGDTQAAYEDQALMVINDGSTDWSSGDGTITITIFYTIVSVQ